jgi:predicted metal-dependent hydrolase
LTLAQVHTLVADGSERIGVTVRRVQVGTMRRKWASCSSRGTLTLSADLLRLPRDLLEYVVCHELVHLRVPEHGKGWQSLMGAYLPGWREREQRLAEWMLGKGEERARREVVAVRVVNAWLEAPVQEGGMVSANSEIQDGDDDS